MVDTHTNHSMWYELTDREKLWWSDFGLALIGFFITAGNHPGKPWFVIGLLLLILAIAGGIALLITSRTIYYRSPPADTPPMQPQPAPLPRPDVTLIRSGHKPLNRELPMDRPHPWRTWEG